MFATLQSRCLQKCLKIGFLNIIYSFQSREKMVPPHGDRCLTVDLGPSTFIAMTIDLPTPSTMQVPRVGKPSGTTDPKATDHGSQRGLLRPTPTLQEPRHTGQPPLQAGARHTGRGLRVGVVDSFSKTWFETSDHSRKRSHCVPQAL